MIVSWFFSRTMRQATAMCKHVRRVLAHQRDVLAPKAIDEIELAVQQMDGALAGSTDKAALQKQMENLEQTANKWFKPYPNPAWRENTEVLLVALTVAMGIRTFFLQPFKIPTGSMQPTLYGVTSVPDFSRIDYRQEDSSKIEASINEQIKTRDALRIPTGWERVKEWFQGMSYLHIVADADGELQAVSRPFRVLIFNIRQTLQVGGRSYTIWFPPDYGAPPTGVLEIRAGLHAGQFFHKGEDIVKLRVNAGDHLFVDRLTYNFRPPKRGEIIVFETHGITQLPPEQQDTFYIKRLVGLGGDTLSLHQDYEVTGGPLGTVPVGNLVVDGRPLTAATLHFENLYTFYGVHGGLEALPYKEGHYFGHGMIGALALGNEYPVRQGYLFVMGDNTMNSLDSRYWRDFEANNVIGRSFFVYWPVTDRFGCSSISH